ncbi:hypothetical protein ACJIZ3_004539 [Penstemon smallii]|uniref:RING-type E3 ubiquitin transferase n=1 Tax=Penstemon smallii TaxID=265156 RepID=A0ABD3S2B4_9LAMI
MIGKFDRNDRRILKFPAVHPCEEISPATLLDSLIRISHKISNWTKTKFIATQRKNTREINRQVSILSVFFEEIRDHVSEISNSMILCLSELHHTCQMILFLLEDCTREGARTFILMKAHFISTQFRALIRGLATALDVLPLNSIDISIEVKELIQMLSNQARKARMELEFEDESTVKRMILVLNQFENKFEPDRFMIRNILGHLGIRKWEDCQKEVKFLEEQIRFQYSDEDFKCPISLELMSDPVTISTGQTYDRASIQKWLKSGNLICPKTGEQLKSTEMVPNTNLKKLIHQFCAEYGVSLTKSRTKNCDVSSTILPGSPASAEAIRFLSEFLALRLSYGTDYQQNKAAYEIRLLAKSNLFNRTCLVEAGTIPPLLELLDSNDFSMQENAVSALLKLSKQPTGQKEIVKNGGLGSIVLVLKNGKKLEARQTAAATIFYLCSTHEHRKTIGEKVETIPALLELIKEGTINGKKNSIVAMFALLLYYRNRERAILAGAVPVLLGLLVSCERDELKTDALAVLSTLADSFDGSMEILRVSGLSLVVRLLRSIESRAGKEYCVSTLHSLCNNCGAEVVGILAKDESLMSALYLLLTEGTSHASRKSRSLIKILQRFCETRSTRLKQFVDLR